MTAIGSGGISIGLTPTEKSVLSALGAGLDENNNVVGIWLPRSGTYAQMSAVVPVSGEVVLITDRKQYVIGDGSTAVSALAKVGQTLTLYRNSGSDTPITNSTEGILSGLLNLVAYAGKKWLLQGYVELTGAGLTVAAPIILGIAYTETIRGSPPAPTAFFQLKLPLLTTYTGVIGVYALPAGVMTQLAATEHIDLYCYLDNNVGAGTLKVSNSFIIATSIDDYTDQTA